MLQQNLHAGFVGRRFERPHQAVAGARRHPPFRLDRLAGLHQRIVQVERMRFARRRVADRAAAEIVGSLVEKDDAVRAQPFERRGAMVGEGANELAVVVPIVGEAIRLNDRPIGQIAEHEIGRVLDTVLLLRARAAAERKIAAAADGVAADVILGFEQHDVGARFPRDDRRGKSRRPGADHDHVGLSIPMPRRTRLRAVRTERCRRAGGADRLDPLAP